MANDGGVAFHRMLVNDRQRSHAYRRAIFETVREGDVVLDIGTGSGLLAFFACQAGASRVYAVERSEVVHVAERLAWENGFADRITFIKDDVTRVDLEEPVDVLVSELIAKAVIGEYMEELTALCRDRFLKPDGRFVPESVELLAAPVELLEQHTKLDFPTQGEFDLDFSSAGKLVRNQTYSLRAKVKKLAEPQVAYRIDTAQTLPSDRPDARLAFSVTTAGILHGYCLWFSAALSENITLANHPPGLPSWDNLVLPLQESIAVDTNMRIDLALRASQPVGANPVWSWNTTIDETCGDTTSASAIARFQQSTLAGAVLSKEDIVRRSARYRPQLSERGELLRALLVRLDGNVSTEELAATLQGRFPGHWPTREDAEIELQGLLMGFHSNGYLV